MNRAHARHLAARFFLGLCYIFITLQWLWIFAVGLPPLIKSGALDGLTPTSSSVPAEPSVASGGELSPVVAVVIGIVTLVFLALTIIIMIRLPRTVAKTGDKIIHQATEAVIPVVAHQHALSAKKKQQLSRRITALIQLLLIILPLLVAFLLPAVEALTHQVVMVLALCLAAASLASLALYWLFAPRKKATSRTRSRASRG